MYADVAFRRTDAGLSSGDFTLTVWAKSTGAEITLTNGWTWVEAGKGLYRISAPDVTVPAFFTCFDTATESIYCEGDFDLLGAPANQTLAADAAAIVEDTGTTLPGLIGEISLGQASLANSADLTDLTSRINAFLAAGTVASSAVMGGVSQKLIYNGSGGAGLWDDIRIALRDKGKGAYPDEQMLTMHNRAVEEIQLILMRIGADVASRVVAIEGDGESQDFALPEDFRAFAPGELRPRVDQAATSNFTHGRGLEHIDQLGVMTVLSTKVGTPRFFTLITNASTGMQYVRFDCKLTDGIFFDGLYYTKAPTIATVAAAKSTNTPWLGLLDLLIARTMELYLREGLEYTLEARAAWRKQTELEAVTMLGLRHLQTRQVVPSMLRRGGR